MNTQINTPIDTQTVPGAKSAHDGKRARPFGRSRTKGMLLPEDKALRLFDDKAIRPEETK